MRLAQKNRFQPKLEGLEERNLMSVDPTFSSANGMLFIKGTSAGDQINVAVNGSELTVNSQNAAVAAQVRYIFIADGFGHDTITVGQGVNARVIVSALVGNDTITLNNNSSQDVVYGWKGDKVLFAGSAPMLFNNGWNETHVGAHEVDLGTVG
jgi:hypothetical protein